MFFIGIGYKTYRGKTEIFIRANETPTIVKSNLKTRNHWKRHNKTHTTHQKSAVSIAFLIPILGRNEAKMKEQIAIGRSLKPSRTLAEDFEIPKFCCTCKITVPTEFSKIAKTK